MYPLHVEIQVNRKNALRFIVYYSSAAVEFMYVLVICEIDKPGLLQYMFSSDERCIVCFPLPIKSKYN